MVVLAGLTDWRTRSGADPTFGRGGPEVAEPIGAVAHHPSTSWYPSLWLFYLTNERVWTHLCPHKDTVVFLIA